MVVTFIKIEQLECPHVRNNWNRVFSIISTFTIQPISQNPSLVLLSLDIGLGSTLHHRELIDFLLTAVRLMKAQQWKNQSKMPLNIWDTAVSECLTGHRRVIKGITSF